MMLFHVHQHIIPAALSLLPPQMGAPSAVAMLLAIGLQESQFEARRQQPAGPARGLWQFEPIGVRGVLTHPRTETHVARVLHALQYGGASTEDCYHAIEHNDVLAACFARLLLWSLPDALPPDEHAADIAWRQYLKAWRPGKPRPKEWPGHYGVSWDIVACES
jgi:hypothetical protein